MTTYGDRVYQLGGQPLDASALMAVGNIYRVCQTTNSTVYSYLYSQFGDKKYADGSSMLYTDIQSALDATVECRNDYVLVQPDNADYDITAALTMTKKNVHLICPPGISYDIGSNNSCRIEQTTDSLSIIAVSDAAIEIAGFYLKPDASASAADISLAATSYALNIHHNYLVLKTSVTSGAAIVGAGDAGAWGNIERNHAICQVSSQTYGSVISIGASATGTEVSHNQITIGNASTATVGISNGAYLGNTNFNVFSCCGGTGVATVGGTISTAVSIATSGCAIGNRGAVGTGELLGGGTADHSFCDNLDGLDGGSVVVET